MYAPNSALLNALAHHKINFKQVLKFIESRYDFEPTPFQNGSLNNAAGENQGSCKVLCFAHLNNFNQLDTLSLFAEHYQAVKDHPEGTDHQNIRQFIQHGWAGVHFEGHALTPKANIDAINAQAAQRYANGGSEFEETEASEAASEPALEAQPGAAPVVNESSNKLSENMQNLAEPSVPKDADGSPDHQDGAGVAPVALATDTPPLNEGQLEAKAEQAIQEAQAVKQHVVPPSPGSSGSMATETTYYTDNDTVTDDTVTDDAVTDDAASASSSASGLIAANAGPLAANPAAFIDEKDSVSADSEVATSPAQTTASSADTADSLTSSGMNASGLASASASQIAASNAAHLADNPAEFIDEKNTLTAADEAATAAPNTSRASTTPEQATDQPILDGHGAADPATKHTRDGELTEQVASSGTQPANKS